MKRSVPLTRTRKGSPASPERLAELCAEWRRLAQAATDAPWRRVEHSEGYWIVSGVRGRGTPVIATGAAFEADRDLIVWMRNHAEEIIAALESRLSPKASDREP